MQALPHLPQLRLSDWVLVQPEPHWVLPPGQELLQLPLRQASPLLQASPQLPQLAGSFCVLVQIAAPPSAPPHWVWLVGQEEAHLLLLQTWPVAQSLPQPPQFWLSEEVSVQLSLQAVWPVGQTSWQLPCEQLFPPEQTVPQLPQFSLSEAVSVHVPLQSVEPPLQPEVLPPSLPVGVVLPEQATTVARAKRMDKKTGRRMGFSGRAKEGVPRHRQARRAGGI
jgi:hypothetical protein